MTDVFGLATFDKFSIEWGPEGLYSFWVEANNFEHVTSSTFQIMVWSNVGKILVENDALVLG